MLNGHKFQYSQNPAWCCKIRMLNNSVLSFLLELKNLSKAFGKYKQQVNRIHNKIHIISMSQIFYYSRSLCQSAICRRGELQTSFQWFNAEPLLRGPPSSSRPMTSFFVTRSQSSSISSRETPSRVCPDPSVVGMSKAKLSLKTGLNVLFFTCVFFFAIRCPCTDKHR